MQNESLLFYFFYNLFNPMPNWSFLYPRFVYFGKYFLTVNSCHFRRGFDTKVRFSDHFCAFFFFFFWGGGGQNKRISVGFFQFIQLHAKQ